MAAVCTGRSRVHVALLLRWGHGDLCLEIYQLSIDTRAIDGRLARTTANDNTSLTIIQIQENVSVRKQKAETVYPFTCSNENKCFSIVLYTQHTRGIIGKEKINILFIFFFFYLFIKNIILWIFCSLLRTERRQTILNNYFYTFNIWFIHR